MPAKKKTAPKAPAKPTQKAPAKPAPKKQAKPAKPAPKKPAAPAKPAPKKPVKAANPVTKPKAKAPVSKAAKPAPKKAPPVKKAPAKAAPPAKKPAAKKAPVKAAPPAKKAAAKPAAKPAPKPAPAKKEVPAPKKAAPVPAKKVAPAPAAKPAKAPAPAAKAAPAPVVKAAAPAPIVKAAAPVKTTGPLIKIVNAKRTTNIDDEGITMDSGPRKPVLPAAFLKKQRQRLIELREAYMNAAEGVANDSLRNNGGNESAFGMHQADAGSDAYDRDFALSLLAKEQDAIYEINEALTRIDAGTYGICEMSGETIFEERLEALPFTRFTVACQARIEGEQRGGRWNRPVRSLFGLDDSAEDSDDEKDEEETTTSQNNNGNESLDFSKE
jgi:RNA polymerase-binding transcription factor DksA